MEIKITYKGVLNGIKGIWCDTKPDGLYVEEELYVLKPSSGFKLKNKNTDEESYYVVLGGKNEKDDWKEIKDEDFPVRKETKNG